MFAERSREGAHILLVDRHLLSDDDKFQQYFRLTPHLFAIVLGVIKEDLEGIPTNWIQKPLTASLKLFITLR